MRIAHLHTQERVLTHTGQSVSALLPHAVSGAFSGALAGGALGGLTLLIGTVLAFPAVAAAWVLLGACALLGIVMGSRAWRETTLTVTTQRILLHHYQHRRSSGRPTILAQAITQTVRWDQYQESVYEGGPLARMSNVGSLTIRYGSMDGTRSATIALLPYARDLKHYLDKIHALKSAGTADQDLPSFVRAPYGKRDVSERREK